MSEAPHDETELYPLRWKLADSAEDLFALHRGKAIAAFVALFLVALLVGYSLVSNGSGDSGPTLTAPATTVDEQTSTSEAPTNDTDGNAEATTGSTEQLEVVPFDRTVPDSALDEAAHGPLILLNSDSAILSGGFSTDSEADSMTELASIIFPGWNIDDRQQVNPGFEDVGPIIARVQGRRLFTPGSIDVNPEFHSAIDQLAVFLVANPGSQVTVVGYAEDDSEDAAALASDRTARVAQRLRTAGLPTTSINIIGPGEEPPAPPRGLSPSAGAIDFYVS